MGPMSGARLDALVERLALDPGDHVVEIGSGKGDLLVRILRRWLGVTAEGFDRNPWFLADADARAEASGVADRLRCLETGTPGGLIGDRSAALAIAIGATGIIGGQEATIAGLARSIRPGGEVLFGDGIWVAEPPTAGLAAFGMDRDELAVGSAGLAALGRGLGLTLLEHETVSTAEWDEYESSYVAAVDDWAAANPDDPESAPFTARADLFRSTYRTWRRDTMGFALVRFRRP